MSVDCCIGTSLIGPTGRIVFTSGGALASSKTFRIGSGASSCASSELVEDQKWSLTIMVAVCTSPPSPSFRPIF
jgi:hypothetical protein